MNTECGKANANKKDNDAIIDVNEIENKMREHK
jgi:hypothetical protein